MNSQVVQLSFGDGRELGIRSSVRCNPSLTSSFSNVGYMRSLPLHPEGETMKREPIFQLLAFPIIVSLRTTLDTVAPVKTKASNQKSLTPWCNSQTRSLKQITRVCVLLLFAPTVSAVSLSVSPNLQQVFSGSSVSLSCVDDGQTADGWTVKRTRGGLTEDCGAAAGFGRVLGSYCVVDLSAPSETFWCEDSSGQQSDRVSFSVQSDPTDKGVILEIPALPVRTGSDVILRCRQRNGATAAYFFIKGPRPKETKPEHIITKVQQSDEGLYSCSTDQGAKSPESSLRVRAPPPPCESVLRLFCLLAVFCPYCILTGLLLSICWSRKTPNKPAISMEMAHCDGGDKAKQTDKGKFVLEEEEEEEEDEED
ncbi:hypothetical protein ACER0C_003566 [Sarotherodon galilaeus]